MKPVLMPTSVHLAFQWRFLAVPMCLYLSQIVAVHRSILFLIAMDYVIIRKVLFSRSRWHSNCDSYGSVFPCHARREPHLE
ncbi:hypothetical protein T07_450 [Trichinella nelsoni]|uniref:Uncharacterized protein n=1 Tax=Trichinella nelsoni TaxID=6336 RepID=A0A0V0RH69_9BILA|nr:hypothetical protein T07_450 [Trichinella nelsoni]